MHNPVVSIIHTSEKNLIRNLLEQSQQSNKDMVITEQSNISWKEKQLLDYLLVDFHTCVERFKQQRFKKASFLTSSSTTAAVTNFSMENDFFDVENKLYESNPLCCINSGLVRPTNTSRQSTSSSARIFPFVFAISLRNYQRRITDLQKQPQRLEEMKARLSNPNFRRYLNKAKQAYYQSTDPFNFYVRYAKENPYDETTNYQHDEDQDENET